ncbi:COP1-interacting protein 4 [Arabidopsis thaliana]|uniref:COP1-interacting protein 4 n=1 Tax=Arabidopsis thaliana TaxID=3702 RepID=A0A1P8BDM3_ARATH|nr:COP1-interacting protein 4 [Arabidopsis thaliana]ANM69670.1 COP1-interacting protein 4 [Arabidopsis thaliana]|eukprot:NP_001331332.1 COP1-interacting protein 4 [Arabidopsis thaliana]
MANRETNSSPEIRCVFVETNLDTRLILHVHKDEIISDFKDRLLKEHKQVFPEIGEIQISALKVKRRRKFYHFSDSLHVCKAFDGISRNWFMYIDAIRVDKGKMYAIMAADQNLELVEKKEEIANGLVLVDDMNNKDLTSGEGLETEVVEEKTRKRRIISPGGNTSPKKSKVDLSPSAVAATTELCGKVKGEVVSQSCAVSPREKLDDVVTRADIESGEKSGLSMGEKQQTSVTERLLEEKNLTVNSELVDGHTGGVVKEVPDNQTIKEALEKVDDLTGTIEQDLEKGGKTADIVMIDQEKDLPPASKLVDGQITSQVDERGEGRRLAPSAVDNLQTAEVVTNVDNQLEASSSLTTGPATEKKRKRMKSSKDHIKQNGNEMADILVDKVGSGEATLIGADEIQAASNLQVAGMASTPHAFVQESKTLDHIGKVTDTEHKVPQERVEIDADQAKSVKSTKKKSSRKAKTPAKEDTLVDFGAQNVEPIKVVDGEGHVNDIRNVLDSLQQRTEVEENMEKSGKKSSKRSKKKDSLNIVEEAQVVDSLQQKKEAEENLEKSGKKSSKKTKKKDSLNIVEEAQVLSVEVNNVAQEEASPINNPKDTDASFTPAKKTTESNASPLKKISEVTDNTEDLNRSMQVLKENADMGDNFGSSQKDDIVGGTNKEDQVTGGAKSKKEKKSLDLHPGGSIDGSMKVKETKGRVQPSSSGTSQLQSRAKNDRNGSKVDLSDASMKGTVNNKKEAVKKSSNSVTVNNSKVNVNNKKEVVKKISNSVTANKITTNFFKDAEEDESKTTSSDSSNAPSDSSSDNDSDVTSSMYMKQGILSI